MTTDKVYEQIISGDMPVLASYVIQSEYDEHSATQASLLYPWHNELLRPSESMERINKTIADGYENGGLYQIFICPAFNKVINRRLIKDVLSIHTIDVIYANWNIIASIVGSKWSKSEINKAIAKYTTYKKNSSQNYDTSYEDDGEPAI